VTRPVFRGLRLISIFEITLYPNLSATCSDETRFQGIATDQPRRGGPVAEEALAVTRPVFRGLRRGAGVVRSLAIIEPACSDETRFQGIATAGRPRCFTYFFSYLAVTRPVFRGLRR